MREIRFKAYHSEYGVGSVISMSFHEKTIEINDDTECYAYYPKMNDSLLTSYNDVELMQYTGLKDKNGVEIYEGDILSTDLDRPYLIVEFRNGAFMFQCHDNGKDYYDFMATTDENSNFTNYHEVIGNVYENPELLGSYE